MRILIGYDGSKFADAAIDDLVHAGLGDDVHALVLSVADVWPAFPAVYREAVMPGASELSAAVVESAQAMAGRARAESKDLADKGCARIKALFPAWQVDCSVHSDSPANAVVEEADKFNADLIVIGSHGRGALARLVFGSISQKVLRYAGCSVRIGRHVEHRHAGPLRILLAMDTSENSAAALAAVAGRKWPQDVMVHIVTAVDARLATVIPMIETPIGEMTTEPADARDWLGQAQREAAEELRRTGLAVTTVLKDGDPKHVLLEEAESWHADCIFVGAKGLSRVQRFLLGSVSAGVAARAHCSVEVVRFE